MDAHANDAIFSFDNASNYDAETKKFTIGGGWTFTTPIDLSDYMYLIITTVKSGNNGGSGAINIRDNNDHNLGGDSYSWKESGTKGGGMWFDNWNHHNAICIYLPYVEEKGVDIKNIKSLTFGRDIHISNVILTNYASNDFLGTEQYHQYITGDITRSYVKADDLNKFGTICLPYKAISSGAYIYSIESASTDGITLALVDGIMEAGKPYFYQAVNEVGNGAENAKCDVEFFRADWDSDVTEPVANNGLVGTFTETTAPQGTNYMVLSNNKLWTVDSDVTVGANKAYIDLSKVTSSTRGTVFLPFDEATGIKAVSETLNAGKMYDLSGREVAQPAKGIYVVDGKKIVVK
jgi:hypothetical protein